MDRRGCCCLLLFVSASELVVLSQLMDYQVLGQCYPGHTPLTLASARYVLLGVKSRVQWIGVVPSL